MLIPAAGFSAFNGRSINPPEMIPGKLEARKNRTLLFIWGNLEKALPFNALRWYNLLFDKQHRTIPLKTRKPYFHTGNGVTHNNE